MSHGSCCLSDVVECLCAGELEQARATGWQVAVVPGGSNSDGYRVSLGAEAHMVKIPVVDERNRAAREAQVLALLQAAGVPDVPRLVQYEPAVYGRPVVIQTWLEGASFQRPPESGDAWQALLAHLCRIHAITRQGVPDPGDVPHALDDVSQPNDALPAVRALLDGVDLPGEFAQVHVFIEALVRNGLPDCRPSDSVLCRVDHFMRNYLQTANGVGSVDWEYAGWGDPLSDLAELVSHPCYLDVSHDRWAWVLDCYQESSRRRYDHMRRFRACLLIRLSHWAIRCARAAAGVPVPSDRKRMGSSGFCDSSRRRFRHYLNWAIETADSL
jgi:aminoglycoside phosphotransferase (APT) family kinase protein